MVRRVGLLAVVLLFAAPLMAQMVSNRDFNLPPMHPPMDAAGTSEVGKPQLSAQEKAMRRQADLQAAHQHLLEVQQETQQLLALANELEAEVEHSSAQALSVGALKKTQQIEKLAKDIRNKMKGK